VKSWQEYQRQRHAEEHRLCVNYYWWLVLILILMPPLQKK
jgi:hypothetical protein